MPLSREAIEQQMRKKFPAADIRWTDGHPTSVSKPSMVKSKGKHNHKGLRMKHKLTTVLCVLAIAAASFLTVQGYHRYQTWRAAQAAKATATLQAEAHENVVKQTIFNAQVKKLEDQCAKDKASYNALPAFQKAKTAAPQCDLNLVQ